MEDLTIRLYSQLMTVIFCLTFCESLVIGDFVSRLCRIPTKCCVGRVTHSF